MRVFKCAYPKPVALFLFVVVLFQCCRVYEIVPVTLEQAIGSDKKNVKIITVDDRTLYFDSIYFNNDKLYGLMNKNKNLKQKTEVEIPQERIKNIYLLNIKKSRTKTILFSIIVPIGILSVIIVIAGATADYSISWGGPGGI
jgi:hypothetical protein